MQSHSLRCRRSKHWTATRARAHPPKSEGINFRKDVLTVSQQVGTKVQMATEEWSERVISIIRAVAISCQTIRNCVWRAAMSFTEQIGYFTIWNNCDWNWYSITMEFIWIYISCYSSANRCKLTNWFEQSIRKLYRDRFVLNTHLIMSLIAFACVFSSSSSSIEWHSCRPVSSVAVALQTILWCLAICRSSWASGDRINETTK